MSELSKPVDYINKVSINGMEAVRPNGKPVNINVRLSSKEFKTVKELDFSLNPDMR